MKTTGVVPEALAVSISLPSRARRWMPCQLLSLAKRKRVGLGARLEERNFERPLTNGVAFAYELVQPAVFEHAVPLLVDVHAVG